ncbi:hypothetical protein [Streptomyces sp. NBC_00212]|uniref:hypothetical protein n=1 Tax=Streptomyces sp. NBC_00212 TaxID=2975684 RepID=UPI003254949F
MSPTSLARHPLRRLFRRLAVLASATALGTAGLLVTAGPAHADAVIQITDSADPVPVNTPYNYTVTIPDTGPNNEPADVTVDLSGAAATFTGSSTTGSIICFSASGTHAHCGAFIPHGGPATITLTVLPTAGGTVTASAVATGDITGSDSTTTTIASPHADIAVNVTGQPHLGILVPYLTYTLNAHNNGPAAVTSATITASLPPGAAAINLSSGCTTSSSTVTCTYGAIANGADSAKSFRIPLHLLSLGHVSVTGVRTTSAPTDNNAANDTDTATCTVISLILATCP